ncbi:hypothetical protein [Phreatobacter sp.]|uniref:hypothetical protein n=1 Tax=Phreatobacter sp. TaxID=1966341 RepID=UPI003F7243D3
MTETRSISLRLTPIGNALTGGRAAQALSITFAVISGACIALTEVYWASAPQEVGIGTSGYALVLYTRALTFAVLSAAFAGLAVYQKNRDTIVATWASADTPPEEPSGAPPMAADVTPRHPGYFGRRHG